MTELTFVFLVFLWFYVPRRAFTPIQDRLDVWSRESVLRGVDDRRSQIFFQRLIKDGNQLIRRALFLWRLWLGRVMTLVGLCGAARFMLQRNSFSLSREDFLLVALGIGLIALFSWGLFQFLRPDLLRQDVLVWARCVWLQEDDGLPLQVKEELSSLRKREWETGSDQNEPRWHYLTTVWEEKCEALRNRQNGLEEWLPGLEMICGSLLVMTWLCTPILDMMITY